jgi:hypothetical protein
MKKKTNLESGFLFLYDWMPVLETLPAKEVKTLLLALIARQRENQPLPSFRNPLTDSFARMIEPVIRRRLEGAEWAKKGMAGAADPEGVPMGEPTDQSEDKKQKKNRKEEISQAEQRGDAPVAPPLRALSAQERALLIEEGLPADYVDARSDRALEFAAQTQQDVLAVLCNWWKGDKRRYQATQKRQSTAVPSTFDADDFFQAALARGCGEDPWEKDPF